MASVAGPAAADGAPEDTVESLRQRLKERDDVIFDLRAQLGEADANRARAGSWSVALPPRTSAGAEELSAMGIRSPSLKKAHFNTVDTEDGELDVDVVGLDMDDDEDLPSATDRMPTVSSSRGRTRTQSWSVALQEMQETENSYTMDIQRLEQENQELRAELAMARGMEGTWTSATASGGGGETPMGRRRSYRDATPTSSGAQGCVKRASFSQEDIDHYRHELDNQEQVESDLRTTIEALEAEKVELLQKIEDFDKERQAFDEKLEKAQASYSGIWAQLTERGVQLSEVKAELEVCKKNLETERELHLADLSTRISRSRKNSLGGKSRQSVVSEMPSEFHGCGGDVDIEEQMEQLRDENQSLTERLAQAADALSGLEAVNASLREDLEKAKQKFEDQQKVTANFADMERNLRRQLTDVTTRATVHGKDDRLLRSQVASAEHDLSEALEAQLRLTASSRKALGELGQGAEQLRGGLREGRELRERQRARREELLIARQQLRERLEAGGAAEACSLRKQLSSLDENLQGALASSDGAADAERLLYEQLVDSGERLREQASQRLEAFAAEAELRQKLARCREKARAELDALGAHAPREEVLEVLKQQLEEAERHLDAATASQSLLQESEAEVREQADALTAKVQEQLRAREALAAQDRRLLQMLQAINEQLALPPGGSSEEQLAELQAQLTRMEGDLRDAQATHDSLTQSSVKLQKEVASAEARAQRQEAARAPLEEAVEELQQRVIEVQAQFKTPVSGEEELREHLAEAERRLRQLLAQQEENGKTEQELRTRLASAELRLKSSSRRGSGADDAAGGGGTGSAGGESPLAGAAAAEPAVERTKSHSERRKLRKQLLIIRSELREVANAMLTDLQEPLPAPPTDESSWMDTWMYSAKRIVCCRDEAGRVEDEATRNERRRQLLQTLAERLEDAPADLQTFDSSSF